MDRKEFLKICGFTVAGAAVTTGLLHSCTTYYYADFKEDESQFIVPLQEFDKADKEKKRPFVLVDSNLSKYPICVFRIEDNHYVSALLKCTHKGCEVNVEGNQYSCPCHGSEFTNTGEVIAGPAKENLKTFKTTSDEKNIYIEIT